MAYVKPQVLVFQEFTIVPTEITEPLRAHISGPNAKLHRYSNSAEKPLCQIGAYDPNNDTCYTWPSRTAGGLVDAAYVKLHVDNALLKYYEQLIGNENTVTKSVDGRTNWIESVEGEGEDKTAIYYKANGLNNARSPAFADRDVKIGDVVYLRSVAVGENCAETTLWTTVAGFASELGSSVISNAVADIGNAATTTLSTDSDQVGGVVNGVDITAVNAATYNGTIDGVVDELYTLEVIANPVPGCNDAAIRVRSRSKLDDVASITPSAFGNETTIGTRGLKVTFTTTGVGAAAAPFVIGQKWTVPVRQAFTAVRAIASNAASSNPQVYAGDVNDTYIIECTKGGDIDGTPNYPEITVRTAKGLDYSSAKQVDVSGSTSNKFISIGTNGVMVAFAATDGTAVTKMRKGDKWYITVSPAVAGAANKLILQHDLPTDMIGTDASPVPLDIKLFIKSDIQLPKNRLSNPPLVNYETEAEQICVKAGATVYYEEWTSNGVPQPLPVVGGTLYTTYREWLPTLARTVEAITTIGEIDAIPGQLDQDNPLKWGVYKALLNSNGTAVKYTAVADPTDLDSWVDVLERLVGRDDLYNVVPLTFDTQVHNLYAAYVNGESNEVKNNWKGSFVSLLSRTSKKIVGEGAPIAGVAGTALAVPVLATIADNNNATGDQYTLLQAVNGNFIANGVAPGDIVRYGYSVDGFGNESYYEYVVDSVRSENALVLYSGPAAPVTLAQRVEIWHNMNRTEMADDIAQRAGVLANRRICAVWPDQVGSSGSLQPGFFLAAALAGLASGVVPHQGLTNVEVTGFDDFSRSYKLFNETQLNRMAEAGVWIVTQDRNGTPFTRHALTTDMLDLNRREEMIRRNVDAISYLFLNRLRPYIGRTNATPVMVDYLKNRVNEIIRFLEASGYTQELGTQLISGSIRVLQLHPLLKDRIEIVLDLVVPAPLNNIELHLVV